MRRIGLAVFCATCVGEARRVHHFIGKRRDASAEVSLSSMRSDAGQLESSYSSGHRAMAISEPRGVLALLLSTPGPSEAWSHTGRVAHMHAGKIGRMPLMQDGSEEAPWYYEYAAGCIQEGCPIEMVEILVDKLKVSESSPEAKEVVAELERLLVAKERSQASLSKSVSAVAGVRSRAGYNLADVVRNAAKIENSFVAAVSGAAAKSQMRPVSREAGVKTPVATSPTRGISAVPIEAGFEVPAATSPTRGISAVPREARVGELTTNSQRRSVSAASSESVVEELAKKCLQADCSFQAMTDLVMKLKVAPPAPGRSETINRLETLLFRLSVDQEEIEKVVTAAQRELSGIDDKELATYFQRLVGDCFAEGCSLLAVDDLVDKYRDQGLPVQGLAEAMEKLEALNDKKLTKQIAIEKIVARLAGTDDDTPGGDILTILRKHTARLRTDLADVSQSYQELALNCLEEGCEVGTVSELVEQLKAENDNQPSEDLTGTIKELESSLAQRVEKEDQLAAFLTRLAEGISVEVTKIAGQVVRLLDDHPNPNSNS